MFFHFFAYFCTKYPSNRKAKIIFINFNKSSLCVSVENVVHKLPTE